MNSIPLYQAFIEAGVSEESASKAAEDIIQVSQLEQLATKADLIAVKSELKSDIANLETRLIKWMGRILICICRASTSPASAYLSKSCSPPDSQSRGQSKIARRVAGGRNGGDFTLAPPVPATQQIQPVRIKLKGYQMYPLASPPLQPGCLHYCDLAPVGRIYRIGSRDGAQRDKPVSPLCLHPFQYQGAPPACPYQ